MQGREDMPPPLTTRRKYNFRGMKPGTSVHVATNQERNRLLVAFRYYAENIMSENSAYATSKRVDETDPDGVGYRVWFLSAKTPNTPRTPVTQEVKRDEDEI